MGIPLLLGLFLSWALYIFGLLLFDLEDFVFNLLELLVAFQLVSSQLSSVLVVKSLELLDLPQQCFFLL